ncbi:MAG TPA: glycerol-3-phosphate dehydrogenase, partial [Delftia acidovorans]|nr:glycerol-3-phosphate dehydrogenase [Delftia acidovorans]
MNIVVIGAGAWGTALAMSAASRGDGRVVTLWARDAAQAQA